MNSVTFNKLTHKRAFSTVRVCGAYKSIHRNVHVKTRCVCKWKLLRKWCGKTVFFLFEFRFENKNDRWKIFLHEIAFWLLQLTIDFIFTFFQFLYRFYSVIFHSICNYGRVSLISTRIVQFCWCSWRCDLVLQQQKNETTE